MLITVAAGSNWICSFAVPRHLARLARLRSVIAPSTVGDPVDEQNIAPVDDGWRGATIGVPPRVQPAGACPVGGGANRQRIRTGLSHRSATSYASAGGNHGR